MRIGLVLALIAAAAAAYDLLAAGRLRAFGEWWYAIHSTSLQVAQPAIERHVWPPLWDPGVTTVLQQPLAGLLIGLAVLAFAITGLRRAAR
jgi:hypothetical protein